MKKILKIYLPILLIIISIGVLFLGYMLKYQPILLQYTLGLARLHTPPMNTVVKIDGVENKSSKVFKLNEGINTKNSDKLIIYTPNQTDTYEVIIVDKFNNDIGQTNSGIKHYKLFFEYFLVQTDSAYGIIYASNKAKWGYDPNLKITESKISYKTEKLVGNIYKDVQVEIFFEGE